MKKILFFLLCFLTLCGSYFLWDRVTESKSFKELDGLIVTAENVSPTKATLRLKHPDSSVLKKYRIADDCYFILKEEGTGPSYLDSAEFKEDGPVTMMPDLTAVYDKSWEHLYGSLEQGEYILGIVIKEKNFFKTRTLRVMHVDIQVP